MREAALAHAIEVQEAPVGGNPERRYVLPHPGSQGRGSDQGLRRSEEQVLGKRRGRRSRSIIWHRFRPTRATWRRRRRAFRKWREHANARLCLAGEAFALAQIYFSDGRNAQGEAILRDLIAHPTVFVSSDQATITLARHYVAIKNTGGSAESCWSRCASQPGGRPGGAHHARRIAELAAPMLARLRFPANQSRGRRYPEPEHPYRNSFQRDRDRVVHSRAFRRLEAKTQVFTPGLSDHFRNRLTHTIEVAQVARTVANVLQLDEDLTEALALAHDIGHPPFAHAGEEALDREMRRFGERFDHNLHALRIVENFEQRYARFPGLNLTFEVREGIVKHSRDFGRRTPDWTNTCRTCVRRSKRN